MGEKGVSVAPSAAECKVVVEPQLRLSLLHLWQVVVPPCLVRERCRRLPGERAAYSQGRGPEAAASAAAGAVSSFRPR